MDTSPVTEIGPKRPRIHEPQFLAFIRTKACCTCGNDKSEAAHIRSGSIAYDKPPTGMQEKPSDKWALPQCRPCHRTQHSQAELEYWHARGIDPFALAQKYYAQYLAHGGGVKKPRKKRTTIRPRLPKEQRAKIRSRSTFR